MKKLWIGVIIVAVIVLVAMMIYQPATGSQDETTVNPDIVSGSGNSIDASGDSEASTGSENTNPSTGSETGSQDGITMAVLASHNTKNDCWVAYEDKVYDITKWLPVHPGGSRAIEPYCGTSSEFTAAFTGQHGTKQVAKLKNQEFVGDLV